MACIPDNKYPPKPCPCPEIPGPPGPQGPIGLQGPQGPQGNPCENCSPISAILNPTLFSGYINGQGDLLTNYPSYTAIASGGSNSFSYTWSENNPLPAPPTPPSSPQGSSYITSDNSTRLPLELTVTPVAVGSNQAIVNSVISGAEGVIVCKITDTITTAFVVVYHYIKFALPIP